MKKDSVPSKPDDKYPVHNTDCVFFLFLIYFLGLVEFQFPLLFLVSSIVLLNIMSLAHIEITQGKSFLILRLSLLFVSPKTAFEVLFYSILI